MISLFLLIGFATLVSKLTTSDSAPTVTMGAAVGRAEYIPPPRLQREKRWIVATMQLEDADEVERRARKVHRLYPGTAKLLYRRSKELRANEDESSALKSPFENIANLAWTSFSRAMARTENDVTPTNHIGIFSLAYPRLAKLGKVTNLRKEKVGEKQLWTGEFVAPLTLEKLLQSPSLQYSLFVESLKQYDQALQKFETWIGKTAEGKRITRSGLFALVHKGGVDGARAWLASPGDRNKYPHTTEAFKTATEIF